MRQWFLLHSHELAVHSVGKPHPEVSNQLLIHRQWVESPGKFWLWIKDSTAIAHPLYSEIAVRIRLSDSAPPAITTLPISRPLARAAAGIGYTHQDWEIAVSTSLVNATWSHRVIFRYLMNYPEKVLESLMRLWWWFTSPQSVEWLSVFHVTNS